jgi:phage-related holin
MDPIDTLKEWIIDQYFKKEAFYGWMKVLIPVIIIFVSSCIAYALVNNSNVAAAQTEIRQNTEAIEKLNSEINRKLDLLIDRANQVERLERIKR